MKPASKLTFVALLFLGAVVTFGTACESRADLVIGVNFNSGEASGTGTIGTKTPPVAGVVPQSNWNDTTGASGTLAAGAVLDSTGGFAPGVAVAWVVNGGNFLSGHGTVPSAPATGNQALMAGNLDPRNGNAPGTATMTVTGLGSGYTTLGYDVLVYFDGNAPGDHRTAHFRLDLDGDLVNTTADIIDYYGVDRAGIHFENTQTFVQATLTTNTSAADFNGTNPLPPSSNYVRFTGLNNPNFVVTSMTDGTAWNLAANGGLGGVSTTRRSNVQGFQIVAVAAVPESHAIALTMAVCLLLTLVWKRT